MFDRGKCITVCGGFSFPKYILFFKKIGYTAFKKNELLPLCRPPRWNPEVLQLCLQPSVQVEPTLHQLSVCCSFTLYVHLMIRSCSLLRHYNCSYFTHSWLNYRHLYNTFIFAKISSSILFVKCINE